MLTDIDIDIKLATKQITKLHHWTIGSDLNHTQNYQLTIHTMIFVEEERKDQTETINEAYPLSFVR